MIAILTEMIGSPTPMRIPLVLQRQLPTSDLTFPIAPQEWHFRQSIDYSITANRAVLDFASRYARERALQHLPDGQELDRARQHAITWTPAPHRYAAVAAKMGVPMARRRARRRRRTPRARRGGAGRRCASRSSAIRAATSSRRTSRTSRPRRSSSTRCARSASRVQRATREFDGAGQDVSGRLVRRDDGAGVPAARDRHVRAAGSSGQHSRIRARAPTPPYDNAGWTLAFQMGVEFDRILDGVHRAVRAGHRLEREAAGRHASRRLAGAAGYLISHQLVDSFAALNRLLAAKEDVLLAAGRRRWYVAGAADRRARRSSSIAAELGVGADGDGRDAAGRRAEAARGRASACGISTAARWTPAGRAGSSSSISSRSRRVFAPTLDAGNLNAKYDVLVFVEGGIPARRAPGPARAAGGRPTFPAEFRPMLGRVTAERTMPEIRQFVENGGTVITIGASSTNLARHLKLPIEDHLVENGKPLPAAKFYAPGSVLTAQVDVTHPIAHGMKERTDVFFDNSPVFRLGAGGRRRRASRRSRGSTPPTPLKSGWAWGQHYLRERRRRDRRDRSARAACCCSGRRS